MYEGLATLLEEDVLSSYDYWNPVGGFLEPEQKLMLGVLEDAIACLQKNAGRPNSFLFRETVDWFVEEKSAWLFSFENICAAIGIDSHHLRQRLLCRQGKPVAVQPGDKRSSARNVRKRSGRVVKVTRRSLISPV